MKKRNPARLDFEVDKLTNSIENSLTGEIFETEVIRLSSNDLLNAREWIFDWQLELDAEREVYKLIAREDPITIHRLISLKERHDHIFIHLIESASFNKGKSKLLSGALGNLVAFACKMSFEKGYNGYVLFLAKSQLVEHYENSLGAKRFWGDPVFLNTEAVLRLVRRYYKDFDDTKL